MAIPRLIRLVLLAAGVQAALGSPLHAKDFSVALEGGYFDMTNARSSAKAVFGGSSGGATFGAELQITFAKGIFAAAGVRSFHKTGQRVFVADSSGQVFPLGHPLEVRLTPIYAALGYRLRRLGPVVPYLALGVGTASFREESRVAGVVERESVSKAYGHAAAGLEYGARRWLRLAMEAAYSTVPDTIGVGGVSRVYDEKNVGGLSVTGKLILIRTR